MAPALQFGSARGRWTILATVLGSGLAALDATVVGIALPAIGREFHAEISTLQWVSVDTAILHIGAVRYPITGPVRYSMTQRMRSSSASSCGRAMPSRCITRDGLTSCREGLGDQEIAR